MKQLSSDEKLKIIDIVWDSLHTVFEQYNTEIEGLVFHDDLKNDFEKLFLEKYNDIMMRFMKDGTETLDAHKQAALLTICILQLNIVEHKAEEGKISILPQLIAVNVGLSYMNTCINKLLYDKHIKKTIPKYYLPVAIACDTPYIEIMCRILYHEQNEEDMDFNILELADRYFLIEYINLLNYGIEPKELK